MTWARMHGTKPFDGFVLDQNSQADPALQTMLEELDRGLRVKHEMQPQQTAVGVLDLKSVRLAMVRPDLMMYGASIPKVSILLAFFQQNPEAIDHLTAETQRELGLMIKNSSNEMATQFSRSLGLKTIQRVLDTYGFYDSKGGGGIWMGKHYGDNSERIGDPVGDHSHAVTVRQLLRFYLLLEQGKLISKEASARMRQILASPDIPHDPIKFVKGLEGRNVEILRKWGSWEDWLHDSAIIQADDRHYVLVGLTHHPAGDEYLSELAAAVEDVLKG
ncbi:MAG TPA: serine hydrolase [Patescibacteria group bacterium]|nr:serine hydrolase [Patescibacteria group bacterium]